MGRLDRLTERLASPLGGLSLTVLALLVTELFTHVIPLPEPAPVVLLLLGLAAVSYAALRSGLAWGIASAAFLAAYTLHFLSPHETLVDATPTVLQGAATMLAIGIGMAGPMALIRRRETRLRTAVERRNRELEERNAELTEANAALEAFGYVVSHDLKEPVRAIENYLEAADEEYGSEPGRHYLRAARDANQRLHRMLQGLLEYSRASSAPASQRAVDVEEVVRGDACRGQYETLLRERGGELVVDGDLPRVLADDVILAQLLGNLILNALRHNPSPRPRVRIRAAPAPAERAHLVVEDSGPGFPPDVLARFGSLKATRPASVKGGFGLVISQRAASRLGGRMWLENAPHGQVHVELDAAPPLPAAPPEPSPQA